MSTITDQGFLEHKILVEQIKMLYRSMLLILIINLLISSGLCYALWDVVSHTTLAVWMGLMLVMLLVRAFIFYRYRHQFKPELASQYGLFLIVGSAASGLIWGFGAYAMLPQDNFQYQIFIMAILFGMGVGSTSSLYIYLPAFFAFFPVLMLPAAFKLMMIGGTLQLSIGVMTVIYVIVISFFNIGINRNLKLSLRLRFENIDLVEQLREQKSAAEHANKAKSKFLAAASHDLRQPLYALTLFTSVLDEMVNSAEVQKVVNQIRASVNSLQNLFNALLDISQLEAGVLKTDKRNFLLQPVFNTLANDFDPIAREKGLQIHWPNKPFAVHSDRKLLEQILRNLIGNAIRYTEKGGVEVSCEVEDSKLVINVKDTGIGIAPENHQNIFDEFNQLSNPERDRNRGLGLGLAIVQQTARLLGHPVHVDSQRGKGSTFSISVERVKIEDCATENKTLSALEDDTDTELLIVVIDDDESVREGTQSLLQSWGCQVITAEDQHEVLDRLESLDKNPDGIIADYRLRGGNTGVHAIHAIHEKYHDNIPALIVSGDIEISRLQDVAKSGFQMLHKPVKPLKLRTFLRNVQKLRGNHQA